MATVIVCVTGSGLLLYKKYVLWNAGICPIAAVHGMVWYGIVGFNVMA